MQLATNFLTDAPSHHSTDTLTSVGDEGHRLAKSRRQRLSSSLPTRNGAIHQEPYSFNVEKASTPSLLTSQFSKHTRRSSSSDEENAPASPPSRPQKSQKVAWRDLPNRRQLAILTLARLSEPLTQSSLRAYMFYQLKSFDPNLPDSTVSSQAGILESSFAAAQFLTAFLWGRAADSERCGRKTVLLIGLSGTFFSCIGFGFSRSFWQAVCFRALGGALNGNVGVMRTMISEIIKEKK